MGDGVPVVMARYNGVAMPKHLQVDQDALAAFCKRHRIAKLSLFGVSLA